LDVGCGRGAVLMLAAHRVPRGKRSEPISGGVATRAGTVAPLPSTTHRSRASLTESSWSMPTRVTCRSPQRPSTWS
jgi:hypothetical protein